MLKKRLTCMIIFLVVFIASVVVSNASAIGKWQKGIVNLPPYHNTYTYIIIDHIKYTVMPEVKVVDVYKKNGSEYQDVVSLESIYKGAVLLFKVEGNRIYQIQILH